MLDFLKLLFDWKDLLELAGFDAVIYAALALIGTVLFTLRMGLALVLGIDGDMDMDVDHGGGFGLLSLLSITAFLMGTGWMGLIARLEWELAPSIAAVVAVACGGVLMFLSVGMMLMLRKAAHDVPYDPTQAVGHVGTVYMAIPVKGEGQGQIRVVVQGRSVLVNAVSTGEAIESFTDIRVVEARDRKTLIVEPA